MKTMAVLGVLGGLTAVATTVFTIKFIYTYRVVNEILKNYPLANTEENYND